MKSSSYEFWKFILGFDFHLFEQITLVFFKNIEDNKEKILMEIDFIVNSIPVPNMIMETDEVLQPIL